MKKALILLSAFVFINSISFGQIKSGEVVYKVKTELDIEKFLDSTSVEVTKKVKPYVTKILSNLINSASYLSFRLRFTNNEARFKGKHYMEVDNGLDLNRANQQMGGESLYYVNIRDNLRLRQKKSFDKDYLVKRKISRLKWKITNDLKTIKGYKCRKATTKVDGKNINKITAWFSPQLPFQFGPKGYAGLPGLILELKQMHWFYYASKIKLKNKSITIEKPSKGKLISREDFLKELEKRKKKRRREYAN